MKTPILGSSYVARSVNAANARMVNLFPEIVPDAGKEPAFLNRAPGLSLLVTVGSGPLRGEWVMGAFLYVVSGSTLYKVDSLYNVTTLGTVSGTTGPVSMTSGIVAGNEWLFIACNGPSYLYNDRFAAFAQIVDPSFPGAVTVGYLDGYFTFNQPNSQRIYVLPLDLQTFDASQVAINDGASGNTVGIAVTHRELWVFSDNAVQVWYDAGLSPGFPFAPIQGALSETGCAGAYTIAKMDNSIFWLGRDPRGQGIVYRSKGYTGERISTHAVEWQIQQYGDISDAIAYTYQQDGHAFYVLTFPSANATWVYDSATQSWHERAGFNEGTFTRHQGNCQAFFNNVTTIGDYTNGNLYKFDLNVYTDNGSSQKWLRSWRALPPDGNTLVRSAHHSLQLDCETGVGINTGQGSDPQVMLRWSDDAGHTWSGEHWVRIGAIGNYGTRAIWRRLGMTTKIRDRVYEVSGTDPVKIAIMGAELLSSGTNA